LWWLGVARVGWYRLGCWLQRWRGRHQGRWLGLLKRKLKSMSHRRDGAGGAAVAAATGAEDAAA
jgi:hypothetical protein